MIPRFFLSQRLVLWGWNFQDWSRFGRDKSGGQGKGLAWSHPDGGEITKGVNIDGEGHQRLTWGSGLTGTGWAVSSGLCWPASALGVPQRDILVLLLLNICCFQFLALNLKVKAELASFWLKEQKRPG